MKIDARCLQRLGKASEQFVVGAEFFWILRVRGIIMREHARERLYDEDAHRALSVGRDLTKARRIVGKQFFLAKIWLLIEYIGRIIALALAAQYPFLWAAVGIHGQEAGRAKPGDLNRLLPLLEEPRAVALGEIGLDYHYDDGAPREVQRELLERQLQIAVERDIPVILHDREAHEDMWKLLQRYKPRGVMHCFSGSVEMARDLVGIGMYIGLGGAVTFKNARRPIEVAAWVPEDRLLIETDAPYMTPAPFRGKRNSSALIPYTAEKIAQVRGMTPEQVLRMTRENAERLFGVVCPA